MKSVTTTKLILSTIIGLACCEIILAQVRFSDDVTHTYEKPMRTILIDAQTITEGCRIEIHVRDSNLLVVANDQSRWFPFYSGEHYQQQFLVSGSQEMMILTSMESIPTSRI